MSSHELPLMEFDPSRDAVVDPARAITPFDVPDSFVLCFFQDAIEGLVSELGGAEIGALGSEMGRHPIFEIDYGGQRLGVALAGVGAPLAAGWLDELIALWADGSSSPAEPAHSYPISLWGTSASQIPHCATRAPVITTRLPRE
jgi:hypothetical protein